MRLQLWTPSGGLGDVQVDDFEIFLLDVLACSITLPGLTSEINGTSLWVFNNVGSVPMTAHYFVALDLPDSLFSKR